ncbi:Tetratricopeptide repeat protein 29 [Geranomyces variabilis]|uniref:Tetratricopeptide repeat protein 29 n=1 Tax=Geranomyces variabilis TaxID=109894 RepID=A0AAD5XQZ7_9FUNG|nr:Tetratricopeptide repeat protein 29 [Geranomyces variabilis]
MLPAISPARNERKTQQLQKHQPPSSSPRASQSPRTAKQPARTPVPLTQTLCLDLLRDGHVASYIDFFRMAVQSSLRRREAVNPDKTLHELKDLLTAAESSHRRADPMLVYTATKNIARHFATQKNHALALAYYRDALRHAKDVVDDPSVEIEAARNVGVELEADGRQEEASEMYEESRILSRRAGKPEAEHAAAKSLVSVRMKMAKQMEKSKRHEEAIEQYNFCVQILQESHPDEQTLNDLNYRLGRAHQQIGAIPTAIEFLETFLLKVRKHGDRIKEGWAQAVLASCHESVGNLALASECLTKFLAITESDPSQKQAQAQACNHLGNLCNRMGDYELAVKYFEKHYQLACGAAGDQRPVAARPVADDSDAKLPTTDEAVTGAGVLSETDVADPANTSLNADVAPAGISTSRPLTSATAEDDDDAAPSATPLSTAARSVRKTDAVGLAQVQLGISRANAHMDQFFKLVEDEKRLGDLLRWKATHAVDIIDAAGPSKGRPEL